MSFYAITVESIGPGITMTGKPELVNCIQRHVGYSQGAEPPDPDISGKPRRPCCRLVYTSPYFEHGTMPLGGVVIPRGARCSAVFGSVLGDRAVQGRTYCAIVHSYVSYPGLARVGL